MKVSPIPGFGSFGVYIDDIDMDYMTDEQWMEIGKIFIDEMVVVFRNIKMTKDGESVLSLGFWTPDFLIIIHGLRYIGESGNVLIKDRCLIIGR